MTYTIRWILDDGSSAFLHEDLLDISYIKVIRSDLTSYMTTIAEDTISQNHFNNIDDNIYDISAYDNNLIIGSKVTWWGLTQKYLCKIISINNDNLYKIEIPETRQMKKCRINGGILYASLGFVCQFLDPKHKYFTEPHDDERDRRYDLSDRNFHSFYKWVMKENNPYILVDDDNESITSELLQSTSVISPKSKCIKRC